MRTIETIIRPSDGKNLLVIVHLGDRDKLEDCRESISIAVQVETVNDTPFLKEVQREALEKARRALDLEISATKTAPRPSA